MKKELATKYNHLDVEKDKYQKWLKADYFTAKSSDKPPFSIVIPPPNVTGKLHLGHAWNSTVQDIIARFKRMSGFDVLWLAGMDHAGISTQAKVDQRLSEQGTDRYKIGREEFLKQAWLWKDEYAAIIRQQWGTLGLSLDYSRERFTLDEGLSKAVTKVFCDLYREGLIYQGYRIINWDPQARTALSNLEVIHKEIEGIFYTFNYQVLETGEILEVSTTRPETMFGDVCVVLNPEDERYVRLEGKHVINPANHEVIPIIADEYVEREFGTGVMKCTPAHDANDFIIGEKYNLEMPVCINPDGSMNDLALEFSGLDRFACRKALVKKIEGEGNLVKKEKHIHQVGHSERTDCIVEPYLSKQWFVKMEPLANEVLKYQDNKEGITFFPNRFDHIFCQWLDNIEDWCISRQLWWGHRIPAYYHKDSGEIIVSETPPSNPDYIQDEDVLDTWFSSALWPFSTLGWPDDSDDLKRYYPTSVLVTAYDIIFFWVARMAFQARYFTKQIPFEHCLIHGLVRDEQGRKMSKSLGNGIDPMEVIEKYGADALRFFLTTNSTPGMDLRFSVIKVEAAWNFINKIWNAARYVLLNLDEKINNDLPESLGFVDHWIMDRLDQTITSVSQKMETYEFSMVGNELYDFIWNDFCSSYIELAKAIFISDDERAKETTKQTLKYVLIAICKLLHPFMPFVSEEIYEQLSATALCISEWPKPWGLSDPTAILKTNLVLEAASIIRATKTQYQVKPKNKVDLNLYDLNNQIWEYDDKMAEMLIKTAGGNWLESKLEGECVEVTFSKGVLRLLLDDLVDYQVEIEKNTKEKERLLKEIKRASELLENSTFVAKAPSAKIEEEKNKLLDYQAQLKLIELNLIKLGNK